MDKVKVELYSAQQAHGVLSEKVWPAIKASLMAGNKVVLEVRGRRRSDAQNKLMWSCLSDLSEQVEWFGKKLSAEGWKHFITAHLSGVELVPNWDKTGFITLSKGRSTSNMTAAELTAVIDLAHAFGSEQGVQWSPTSVGHEYRENTYKKVLTTC